MKNDMQTIKVIPLALAASFGTFGVSSTLAGETTSFVSSFFYGAFGLMWFALAAYFLKVAFSSNDT